MSNCVTCVHAEYMVYVILEIGASRDRYDAISVGLGQMQVNYIANAYPDKILSNWNYNENNIFLISYFSLLKMHNM